MKMMQDAMHVRLVALAGADTAAVPHMQNACAPTASQALIALMAVQAVLWLSEHS